MDTPSLDIEFDKYSSLLTPIQKEFLLSVVESFFTPRQMITAHQYSKEIVVAVSSVENGEYYSHGEVEKMSTNWE
ncbi:MAG: hypothetical protein ABIS01_17255 [Ferruginibacter sp.]